MPEKGDEPFSNPLPPMMERRMSEDTEPGGSQMTNDDFRRLLMTPRATPGEAPPSSLSSSSSSKSREHKPSLPREYNEEDDPRAKRRKRKIFYAKLKKQEAEREAELAKRYRDRARERREGKTDYEETEIVSTTANYRAVAPDVQSGDTAANRRKQLIEESKYLGGDMEHTHLVKGLDYALLQKVRAEITHKEREEEEVMEESFQNATKDEAMESKEVKKAVVEDEHISFKTRLGKNVYRVLFKKRPPERNELFLPGRMAYKVELDDDYAESDIPTTVIRSKADCPTMESHTTLTANDIVINKLTQILSYLRQGQRGRKMKKKEKGKLKEEMKEKLPGHDDNIFNDVSDYALSFVKPKTKEERREKSSKMRDRGERGDDRDIKSRSYFEKPQDRDEGMQDTRPSGSGRDLVQNIIKKYGNAKPTPEPESRFAGTFTSVDKKSERHDEKRGRGKHRGGKSEDPGGSYAECYPGLMESIDACDDSDDEADYSKMDLGNKKGPLSRWDFETQDEYSSYMNNKEAMPKAAFQFGLKMSDGRKTRRVGGQKNEKAELDKEWNKIQQIIAKRKATGTGDGSGGNYKKSKGY
ncbi:protein Red-like [Anneissia japonica]|uniref:protein Red-like n=1 Tax=Anneissia japonica TaxID=1529436 RepID=UPI00142559AB|nr:protein Red-like [Anneissia japonica]